MYPENIVVTGSFTAANPAVAVTVTCGFEPRFVRFVTLDTNAFTGEFFEDMADASFIKSLAGGAIQALISSDGVTPSATGVTFGTACQVATKVTHYIITR